MSGYNFFVSAKNYGPIPEGWCLKKSMLKEYRDLKIISERRNTPIKIISTNIEKIDMDTLLELTKGLDSIFKDAL